MRFVVSGLGALLALGLVAASAMMNWRFGVSIGRTEYDQLAFGGVSVLLDMFKAMTPFFIFWALKNRRLVVSAAGCILWLLCTSYSVTSGLGFAALNRGDTASQRTAATVRYADVRGDLKRARTRLDALGTPRPVEAVEAELARARTDRTWTRTRQCNDATRTDSRSFCNGYHVLKAELGKARTAAGVRAEITTLTMKLEGAENIGVTGTADPQADILSRLLRVDLSTVSTSLVVLIAVLVELGSGLGLFVALNHGELAPKIITTKTKKVEHKTPAKAVDKRRTRPAGDVAKYAVARLSEAPGSAIEIARLHPDYCAWCGNQGTHALARTDFESSFLKLCDVVGFEKAEHDGKMVCLDVQLVA